MNEIQSPTTIREQIQFNSSHYGDRNWLISPETMNLISSYKLKNQQLFFPVN